MTQNNWVAACSAIAALAAAVLNYLKSRKVDEKVHTVQYLVNGRFEDLLAENRRLRETIAATTGEPHAVEIVKNALDNQERTE